MGGPAGTGLHKTIVTVLIESSALYAVNSLLFVGPWGANSHVADIFLPILAETQVCTIPINNPGKRSSNVGDEQVISPLLIIRRLADQSALTSDTIVSGSACSRNQELTGGSGTLPGGYPLSSVDACGKTSGDQLGVGIETMSNLHRDKV